MSASHWHEPIDLEEDWLVAIIGSDPDPPKHPAHLHHWSQFNRHKTMTKLKMENLHNYHLLIVTVKNQDKLQHDLVHSNLCMTFGGFFTSCLAWHLLTPHR